MPFQCIRCHAEIDRNFKACPHCGEPITDFLRRYLDEPIDGKYRILERLGAGGMGEVYKVEHILLRSTRVIKVIRPQISNSQDAHERFLREAQLASKVQHQNVATVHDFSALPDGSHYMVWEFIEGENLAQVLRFRGPLPPAEAIAVAVQALAGLEAIHRAGIVHRDISPENLMITTSGQVKIIDLGVAKSEEGDYAVTHTGIFVGKLRYASPEQLGFLPAGEKIDGRADLYSMAIVIVESLTGKPPFEATSPHQYILQYSDQNVQPLDLSTVPGTELQGVLRQALERDRSKRFPTATDFASALDGIAVKLKTLTDDATLRLTPPSGTTLRTTIPPPPAGTTLRTPIPRPPTGSTLRAPATPPATGGTLRAATPPPPPAAPTVIEAQKHRSATTALLVVAILLFVAVAVLAVGFAAWRFWPRLKPAAAVVTNTIAPAATMPPPTTNTTAATATTVTQPAQQPAASEVTVTPPPPTTATTTEATSSTETVPPKPAAKAEKEVARTATQQPRSQPQQQAQTQPAAQPRETDQGSSGSEPEHSFTEGALRSRNDDAVSFARERLRGVTRVSLDARGDADLVSQLGQLVQKLNLTVSDDAPVRIRFYGAVTHQGFGRKTRAAEATILKNGQTVFRYELKPEPYRVGDNPAEAFARVLSDVFGQ